MTSQNRALIWEQSRTAGVLAGWLALVSGVMMAVPGVLVLTKDLRLSDAAELVAMTAGAVSAAGAVLAVVYQNHAGHIAVGLASHHVRLPVRTFPLTALILLLRFFFLVLLVVFLHLTANLLFEAELPFRRGTLAIELYLVAQALAWSYKRIAGIGPLLGAFVLIGPGIARLLQITDTALPETYAYCLRNLSHPAAFGLVALASGALGLYGVYLERRDEVMTIPGRSIWTKWPGNMGVTIAGRFQSISAAQRWYERQRFGRMLPSITLVLAVVFALVALALSDARDGAEARTMQAAPLFGFVVAALIVGLVCTTAHSRYELLRPVTIAQLSRSRLLGATRMLFGALPVAAVLSVLLYAYFGETEVAILSSAWQHSEIGLAEAAAIVLGPVFLATLTAWIGLWIAMPLFRVVAGATALIAALSVLLSINLYTRSSHDWETTVSFWACLMASVSFAPCALIVARLRGLISIWLVAFAFVGAAGLSAYGFAIAPDPIGLGTLRWLLLMAPAMWVVAPLAAVPLAVQRWRTG